jgi:hypothetical protein
MICIVGVSIKEMAHYVSQVVFMVLVKVLDNIEDQFLMWMINISHHVIAYFAMCSLLTWFKQAFNSTHSHFKNKICAHELQEAKGNTKTSVLHFTTQSIQRETDTCTICGSLIAIFC